MVPLIILLSHSKGNVCISEHIHEYNYGNAKFHNYWTNTLLGYRWFPQGSYLSKMLDYICHTLIHWEYLFKLTQLEGSKLEKRDLDFIAVLICTIRKGTSKRTSFHYFNSTKIRWRWGTVLERPKSKISISNKLSIIIFLIIKFYKTTFRVNGKIQYKT